MAQNLQLLKRRIRTAKNIAQIAKAMEMVSASKIKKAQTAVINNKPYAERITKLTSSIMRNSDLSKFKHSYLKAPKSDKKLILVISPDKGLCGSLNTNLFKKILENDNKNNKLIIVGKKASIFSAKLDSEIVAEFPLGTSLPIYSTIYPILEIVNSEYASGKVSSFQVLFSEFNSIFQQSPNIKNALPIQQQTEEEEEKALPYTFEPNAAEMLNDLLPYYLEVLLYSALIEAYTSEQAARMIAMQNAKNNALDIADYLNLSYNKSRQEKITNELLDLSNTI